jgi:catechol 2,3-dioxygenase-like lactoylglutathione lyase family enzyme
VTSNDALIDFIFKHADWTESPYPRSAGCWDAGAYLSLHALWLCLSLDPLKAAGPSPDYTHFAFGIAQHNFDLFLHRLRSHAVIEWQQNRSERNSLYFLDPDGYKLEAHVGDLDSRLTQRRALPYSGMRFFD